MSTESVCRLCVENAKSYESLYDFNGQKSDVYLLVVKYFDETIINFERAQHLKGICVKCLQKIQYFNHFQKIVIKAQEKLFEDHKKIKMENTLTGYDEEFSLFHINNKSKHDYPLKENSLSNQCNNDAVCERPEESEHIKMPKLEIVDAFSGDKSVQSNNEKFLDCAPSPHNLYTALSVSADDCNQNIDKNESSSIEKSDETNPVNKLKTEIRSPEDIDNNNAKILPTVEYACVRSEENEHIEMPKLEIVDVFSGDESIQSNHEEFLDHTPRAYNLYSGLSACSFSADCNKNIDQNGKSIDKSDETNHVNKVKNYNRSAGKLDNTRVHKSKNSKASSYRSSEVIDNNIAKILPNIECVMCRKMLPTYTHLVQHFKSEHPGKECFAMCCGKKFKRRSSLAHHIHCLHSGPNDYTCKVCNKPFLLRKSLSLHMRAHMPTKRKLTPKRSSEDIDNFISKLLPSVQCGMCKEKQPTFTHLALHFLSEHPEKECYAMCCGKTIKSRCSLESHVSSSHSALKLDAAIAQLRPSLECVVCKETCSTYSLVQYHFESKHPFDQFYIMCCNRKLKDRPKLLEHLHFHENPNSFKCDVCNKPFAQRQYLLCHMRKYHPTSNVGVPKHINDPTKTSDCNNDATCLRPGENEYIEVPKIEIVDVFSGDESIQSYHEDFLDSTLSAHSLHLGFSESSFSDDSKQNNDQTESSSIEKAVETIYVDKVKNKMAPKRSADDIDNNIAKILANIECVLCKKRQPTFTHLVQHFKSEHPAKECYAMCCGKKFKKRSYLASHVTRMHSTTNTNSCKHCRISFPSRRSFTAHMRAHNPIKPSKPQRSRKDIDDYIAKLLPSVECGVCKEKQPTFTHLALHFTAEHPAKECYAMCCGTTIKKRCELAKHVSSGHPAPFAAACKLNGRITDAAIAQLKPYLECVICKETCTTFALLQYHFESKHPFDEFYIMCCNRKLKDRSHLHQHLQFHENPNAFECNVCNKPLAERSSLLRHMRVYHQTSNVEIPKRINSHRKTSEYNNDALCVGSDESKHIEVLN